MMASNLKQKAISGMVWSAFEKFGVKIISFVSNILLARLLSPDDYGCIGMLAIFMTIATVFITGGFQNALIQKKEPTKDDYSTVFYWNIIIAIIFYFILFITAPLIADFYRIQLLSKVLRVQGIVLIINSLTIIQLTRLRKYLLFKKLALVNIGASLGSVTLTIVFAVCGWGIWALVMQQISLSLFTLIILCFIDKWKPQLRFSIVSFKELFSYGSFLLLSDLLNSICDNVQGLIIGRKFSSATMGYYTQAKRLEEVPTSSISMLVNQVSFPIFAEIQDDKNKLNKAIRKSMLSMNYLNFPLMILLLVIAEPLITLLFSEKWLPSVPYFQILCLAGLVNCMQSVNYQVVCAVGKSKTIFKWNIIKRTIGIGLIFAGMIFGVEGILMGMVIGFYFTYIVNACVAQKTTGYTLLQQLKDSFPLIMIAIISAIVPIIIGIKLHYYYVILMIIQILSFSIVYILLSKILKRKELEEYTEVLNDYLIKIKNKTRKTDKR